MLHDLKNPAIFIHGLAHRLWGKLIELPKEKIENYCAQILRASGQIVRLVEQINIYISEKETPHTVENVSVAELMGIILDEFSPQQDILGVRLIEQEKLSTINGDRSSLLRMLRNLVDNALKYSGEKLSEIEISYKETGQYHVFSVRDNGVGLSKEESKSLFSPFQRKESAVGTHGSGLGLAIVKEIAKQHGGDAWTEENKENGTTFVFLSQSHCV